MNAPATPAMTLADIKNPTPREAALPAVRAGFFDLQSFELIQRVSKAFAQSDLVPKTYQGNLANCMIAMDMAQRIAANPLMVMQNLYIVHGNPGWSSKFLIATINACGRYSSLRYEWRGQPSDDNYGCRAWAIEKETGERLDGIWVDWRMVKAEGWDAKNGSKWRTMPDQMFVYRAAAFWQRAYAPELGMGLQTAEELQDIVDVDPQGNVTVTTESLRAGFVKPAEVVTDENQVVEEAQQAVQEFTQQEETKPEKKKKANADSTSVFDRFAEYLKRATDKETAEVSLDEARSMTSPEQYEQLIKIFNQRFGADAS